MRSGQRAADAKSAEPQTARAGHRLLSPGERALWFLQRLAPGSAAYNLAGAIRIFHFDPAALRSSEDSVMAKITGMAYTRILMRMLVKSIRGRSWDAVSRRGA